MQEQQLRCTTRIISITGEIAALLGLGLSHGLTSNMSYEDLLEDTQMQSRLRKIALTLAGKDGGHNKFLESISVYLDIKQPRYWWQEFDTYRVGMTKQSDSTIHGIFKKPVTQANFVTDIPDMFIDHINKIISDTSKSTDEKMLTIKRILPESFLQRRITVTNLKTLRNIIMQRDTHRLPEWRLFINSVFSDGLVAQYIT